MSSNGRGSYSVQILPSARKELLSLPPKDAARMAAAIARLAGDPRPRQSTKLVGFPSDYRIRVGSYRALYIINDRERRVVVYRIGHRGEKDIYRRR